MKIIFKILSLFVLPLTIILLIYLYFQGKNQKILMVKGTNQKILSIPYENIAFREFGSVYTANIVLPVAIQTGLKNLTFMIDTGAVVTAIPAKESREMGIKLSSLPRGAVEGYGGQTTFTYQGTFTAKIIDELVTLPCVFSEIDDYNYILGRKGVFERYTITFNSQTKAVELTDNQQ